MHSSHTQHFCLQEIHINGLVKVHDDVCALAGVNARFERGVTTMVTGNNGSGKSTLLALIAGLYRPTRGEVAYHVNPSRLLSAFERRRIMGVLTHAPMLYPMLSGYENLNLAAALYGLNDHRESIEQALDTFVCRSFAQAPVASYSRGQLQRMALARVALHKPQLLVLDEPTTGLDQEGIACLREWLVGLADSVCCVLSTHDMHFGKAVAQRQLKLIAGKVVDAA